MDDLKLETRLELEMVRRAIVEVSRLPGEESLQTQEFLYQKFHLLVGQRDFLLKQAGIQLGVKQP